MKDMNAEKIKQIVEGKIKRIFENKEPRRYIPYCEDPKLIRQIQREGLNAFRRKVETKHPGNMTDLEAQGEYNEE